MLILPVNIHLVKYVSFLKPYISNKKGEKFARRISYLEDHLPCILKAFDICNAEKYTIKNYMVTNKVFYADIKTVSFEIISFHELKRLFQV